MNELAGRRALLTGASGGLGRYIADELARAGVHLAISARNRSALDHLASDLRGLGSEVGPFPADLSRPDAVDGLATTVQESFGPIDILINNAGVEVASAFTRYPPAEIDDILTVDLLAPLQLTRRLLPAMLARGSGHVVNICSLASKGPLPYGVPYAAAKSGLAGATASLSAEYAGTGVGFSAVIPGFVTAAGVFARHQAQGVAAPAMFGTTTPQKVGRAVVAAIRRNAPEIIVTPYPIRPFLAALAPATAQRLTRWIGVTAVARQVTHLHGRIDDQPIPGQAAATRHPPMSETRPIAIHVQVDRPSSAPDGPASRPQCPRIGEDQTRTEPRRCEARLPGRRLVDQSAHVRRIPASEALMHARVVFCVEPHGLRARHHVVAEVASGRTGIRQRRGRKDHDPREHGRGRHHTSTKIAHRRHLPHPPSLTLGGRLGIDNALPWSGQEGPLVTAIQGRTVHSASDIAAPGVREEPGPG